MILSSSLWTIRLLRSSSEVLQDLLEKIGPEDRSGGIQPLFFVHPGWTFSSRAKQPHDHSESKRNQTVLARWKNTRARLE